MILAVLRVMLLSLVRDRGALAMAFVLPPLIYVIFATIFAATAGDEVRLRVAVLDSADAAVTRQLAAAIRAEPSLRQTATAPQSRAQLEQMVRLGEADAGVWLRADPSLPPTEPPILIIGDAARAMAAPIVAGQVLRLFGELQAASGVQRASPLVERMEVTQAARAPAAVIYYAGAVAMLFLLFSAMHGAMSLIDERQSGLIDRLPAGAVGAGVAVGGKFLFLVLQGVVQTALIFLIAGVIWGVDVTSRLAEWLAITIGAAAMAAGLALAVAALARTRAQAQALANFMVLVLSAIGGSMVPRFLMPGWLQDASWLVPNAWAIEAYHGLIWRDAPSADIATAVGLLVAFGVGASALAWAVLARERRM